jgi:hypothetical protein
MACLQISAPFVLLAYSLVSFYGIIAFVFVGKPFAGHDMAGEWLQKPGCSALCEGLTNCPLCLCLP